VKDACDTHFHIFGPAERYPARDPKLRYKPPHAPLEDYLAWAQGKGFERFVFVQPSAYARDNTCMLDAMRAMRLPCRGIVDVDEDAPERLLAEMRDFGVCGVRVNVSPVHPPEEGLPSGSRRASTGSRRAAPSSAGSSISSCPDG